MGGEGLCHTWEKESMHRPAPVRNFSLPKKNGDGFPGFYRVFVSTTGLESFSLRPEKFPKRFSFGGGRVRFFLICWIFPHFAETLRNTLSTGGNSMTAALRGHLRNHFWQQRRPQPYWGGENSGHALEASNALNYRDPSRTLQGNSRKSSESVCGVSPEFFRNFLRKVSAVLGVWPKLQGRKTA